MPGKTIYSAVTRGRDLISSGLELWDVSRLRGVVDLPEDLGVFEEAELNAVRRFMDWAENLGAKDSYIAKHRKAWWSVGLREPAPILATYMARRPPTFVLNLAEARHLNIAHGIYPREPLDNDLLMRLVKFLRSNSPTSGGRVYSGGLTKFEPGEMERIAIPEPSQLREMAL